MKTKTSNRAGTVLFLACLAQFVVVLDVAIVNVALPTIQTRLHIGQSTVQWVVTAYGLMLGGFLLLGGRIADLWGPRRTLISGLALFTLASAVAGAANSAWLLIAARAVEGLGAAMIPPSALAILAVTFTEGEQRNRAIGLFGATAGISASVGVIASGLLTDGPGWRWIFFINAPIGAALIASALLFLTPDGSAQGGDRARFDVPGAVSVTAGSLGLAYAFGRAATHGWGNALTLALIGASAALLVVFAAIEARSDAPLIPAAAAHNRTLRAAGLSALLLFGSFFAFIFLGSLLMQQVLGYSPTDAGVAWLATTVISFFAAAAAGGKLVGSVGVRPLVAAGFLLLGAAALLLTQVPTNARYATDLLPAFLLAGVAGGLGAPAIQLGALSGVPISMAGVAGGLVEALRELGGGLGIAITASVLASNLNGAGTSHQHAGPGVHAFHAAFWMVCAAAAVGLVIAQLAFPRVGMSDTTQADGGAVLTEPSAGA